MSIDDSGDFDGTFTMAVGTSIDPTTNVDALVVTNSTPADSFVTLNLNGEISNLYASGQNFAALRLEDGWTYQVNIGTTGVLVGNGDALVATAVANSLTISNAGTVTARGEGAATAARSSLPKVERRMPRSRVRCRCQTPAHWIADDYSSGQAVHIAAAGAINVTNAYQYSGDVPVADTGRILGGTEGMRLVSGTSIVVSSTPDRGRGGRRLRPSSTARPAS